MSDTTEPEDENEPTEPEPTPDLTDPKRQRRSRDRIKREVEERASFWRKVLNDRIGRREMWTLLAAEDWGHCFNTMFACGPNGFPQPEATWFRAGEQGFAMRLYQDLLRLDRDGVLLMHEECDPRWPKKPSARRDV